MQALQEIIEENPTAQIVLYGAGNRGLAALEYYTSQQVLCFCDNNPEKTGTICSGKRIISAEQLVALSKIKTIRIIPSLAAPHCFRILELLEQLGLTMYVENSYIYMYDLTASQQPVHYTFPMDVNQYFSVPYEQAPNGNNSERYSLEIIKGKQVGSSFSYEANESVALAVCPNEISQEIEINVGTTQRKFAWEFARFHWLRINKGEHIDIQGKSLLVGEPITLKQMNKHIRRLHLMLLFDSFSAEAVSNGIDSIMPNTGSFFHKGIQFVNCHCHSDWTYPGIASLFTGQYPINHQLLHPSGEATHKYGSLITNLYHKEGYMTYLSNSNWRMHPQYGYIQDMDRMTYVFGGQDGDVAEMTNEVMKHLRAFPQRDHFIILSIYDLHHIQKWVPSIDIQLNLPVDGHNYREDLTEKSVFRGYNADLTKLYQPTLERIDFCLGSLYRYIEEQYDSEEFTAILACDHGVQHISPQKYTLPGAPRQMSLQDVMCKVPFLIRVPGLKHEICSEISENRKVYTLIEQVLAHDKSFMSNEQVKEIMTSECSYQESIYPGRLYEAVIYFKSVSFCYQSEFPVSADLQITLGNGNYAVYDIKTQKNITLQNSELVEICLQEVQKHCQK